MRLRDLAAPPGNKLERLKVTPRILLSLFEAAVLYVAALAGGLIVPGAYQPFGHTKSLACSELRNCASVLDEGEGTGPPVRDESENRSPAPVGPGAAVSLPGTVA